MKAAWGFERRFTVAAAVLALLLGGVLAWEWEQGRQLEREYVKMRKLPVTAVPPLKIQTEFSLPDMETGFPELLARPIFFAGRRPMASAGQGASGAMKKGQFALVGVVITPQQKSALLRNVESGKTETVAMGAQIMGVTLGEVEAGKVVLRMGAESEELPLKVQTGAKPPPPAAEPTPAILSLQQVKPAAEPPKAQPSSEPARPDKQNKASQK